MPCACAVAPQYPWQEPWQADRVLGNAGDPMGSPAVPPLAADERIAAAVAAKVPGADGWTFAPFGRVAGALVGGGLVAF